MQVRFPVDASAIRFFFKKLSLKYCEDKVKCELFFPKSQQEWVYLKPELSHVSHSMQIKNDFGTVFFALAVYSFHLAVKYCEDEVKFS